MPRSDTSEDKRALYQSGRYSMPSPPVCHATWTETDWIQYIDRHGAWLAPMDLAMQDARNHQRDYSLV